MWEVIPMRRKLDASLLFYPTLMAIVYALSNYFLVRQYLAGFLIPIESLLALLFLAELSSLLPGYDEAVSTLFRGLAFASFVYFFPGILPYEVQTQVALFIAGITIASVATKLPEISSLMVRGLGVFSALYALSLIEELSLVSSAFLYAAFASLMAYTLITLEHLGILGGHFIERNLKGVVLIFGLIGLYVNLRPFIVENYPQLAFYFEWGALVVLVVFSSLAVYRHFSSRNLENYLVGEWKKHEGEFSILGEEEFEDAKRAIENFVIHGKKASLIAFLTYYGLKAFPDRGNVERIIAPIVVHREEKYSIFTPGWLVMDDYSRNLEKRIELVKTALREIEKLMG